jgi:hypothetical protein
MGAKPIIRLLDWLAYLHVGKDMVIFGPSIVTASSAYWELEDSRLQTG